MSKINVSSDIIANLKENIKKVPVAHRGQALAIYNKLKQYFAEEEKVDDELEKNGKVFEKSQWDITTTMDQIIDGTRKCTDEELKSVLPEYLKEGEAVNEESNDGVKMQGYWKTCFKNAKLIMKECDEPILNHLRQIDIKSELKAKEKDQPKTMTLKLMFEENEFFENSELSCTVHYLHGEEFYKSEGCDIKWKPGKNITTKPKNKKLNKKQREKKKKGIIEPVDDQLSLFDIFTKEYTMEEAQKTANDPSVPNLFFVNEMVEAIGDIAGEDSLIYYLDCVHDDEQEGLEDDDMEAIDEDEEDEEDNDEDETEDKSAPTSAKKHRKVSTKSNKSKGGKGKAKSRKNTEDEVKVPSEPNKEECKQN